LFYKLLVRTRLYCFVGYRKLSAIGRLMPLPAISAISTTTIAIIAVIISIEQMEANNTTSAKGIYKEYLSLAFANPKYSAASFPIWAPRYLNFEYGSDKREAYEFFVSFLLNSADEILSTPEKDHWKATLVVQFSYHALYLNSGDFVPGSYLCETRDLVAQGIEEYAKRQRNFNLLMNAVKLNHSVKCTDKEWRDEGN